MNNNEFFSKTQPNPDKIQNVNAIVIENLTSSTTEELINKFNMLTSYAKVNNLCISNKIFNTITEEILRKCRQLDDDQIRMLLELLNEWSETESINSANFGDLWSALDDVCLERYRTWDNDKLLAYAELWYKLKLGRLSEYVRKALDRVGRKPSRLTSKQLIKLLFFVNITRRPLCNMYDIENRINECMNKFSVDDLAIISMAFFKTQTRIKNSQIIADILRKLQSEITTVHEINLCAIMKVIRFSSHILVADQLYHFYDCVVGQIDRLSLLSCVHISLVGTNLLIFHDGVLSKIATKFLDNIEKARLKDIERIVYAMTVYNFNPNVSKDFFNFLEQELYKRSAEIEQYPRCLTSCLHYLSLRKVYPIELIQQALDENFLKKIFGKNILGREIFHLDLSLEIEVPDYQGNKLSYKKRELLAKNYTLYPPKDSVRGSNTDKMLFDIFSNIVNLFGNEKYVIFEHILPHFDRADIVFALTADTKKPVLIRNIFDKHRLSDIKYIPTDQSNLSWHAVVVGGWNSVIRNSGQPGGLLQMKLRQLNVLGYNTTCIVWNEWIKLPHNSKLDYLKSKIKGLS